MTNVSFQMQNNYWSFASATATTGGAQNFAPQQQQQQNPMNMLQGMAMIFAGMDMIDNGAMDGSILKQMMGGPQQQQQAQFPQQPQQFAPQQAGMAQPQFAPQQPQNPQQAQQQQPQNPMQQMMQMFMQMMQMLMQMMGMNPQQAQQQNPQQAQQGNGAAAAAAAGNGAAAAAAAGNGGAAAAAAAGNGGAAAAAAAGKGGAAAAAAAGGDKQQLADQLQARWDAGDRSGNIGDQIHKLHAEGFKTSSGKALHDPYEVNVNGEKFMFVKDENKNGKVDAKNEILGINDTKDNLFQGMKELDKNKDGKVEKAEMDAAGVKLAKVGADGKVDLNQTKEVNSVDLNSFQKNAGFNGAGEAGAFNVNLADGTNAQGKEMFESMKQIMSYLSA